ncbi:MAG: phytoene desaturase family protein [Planctomycetota bacterium]
MTAASSTHIGIIGGGLAGLSAAVELAGQGLKVTLIEANRHLGGKMNLIEDSGYSFDMGPTIITMPQVFRGIVRRSGRNPADYCDLVDLDPQWRCFYEDGTAIDLRQDPDDMAAALNRQFPDERPGEGYKAFLEFSRRMYGLSEKVFFFNDLESPLDMMKKPPKEPGVMRDALAMRMHSTMAATAHKSIAEPHVAQLVEHFLQYVGSSPFLAPAILSLIASAQTDHGCWYPMAPDGKDGGTRLIARSLEKIAREQGVEIITGARVERILDSGGSVHGLQLEGGRTIKVDAVVSNCDVQRTNRQLLATPAGHKEADRIARKYEPACAGVVLYLGLDRQYEHLAHHNFLFSGDSQSEFGDIYRKGIPARDPTLYIAAPSRTDPNQAPEGGEALYILVHTAYKRPGQVWDGPGGLLEQYRPIIINKLKRFGMEDIEQHITIEHALTPDGIDRMYNAEGGAIYGLASHGKLGGGFKPRNRSRALDGLYLAGGSANPGPGVPMVLMSGVTAAHAVFEDLNMGVPRPEAGQGFEGPKKAAGEFLEIGQPGMPAAASDAAQPVTA